MTNQDINKSSYLIKSLAQSMRIMYFISGKQGRPRYILDKKKSLFSIIIFIFVCPIYYIAHILLCE